MKIQRMVPMLAVASIEKAMEFYRGLLGVETTESFEEGGSLIWCQAKFGSTDVMFQRHPSQVAKNNGTVFYLYTDDIEAIHQKLLSYGYAPGELGDEFDGRRECEMVDADGNILMFCQVMDNKKLTEDEPYALQSVEEQQRRTSLLTQPHIRPLYEFAEAIKAERHGSSVPYFDPCDGGIHARALFLLERPGPEPAISGFISRNNPDRTAKNMCGLLQQIGIPRSDTLIWNVVPWRPSNNPDFQGVDDYELRQARPYLHKLLNLLPKLEVIVLVGKQAQSVGPYIRSLTDVPVKNACHISPRIYNRHKERQQTQETFAEVAKLLREKANH